MDEGASYEYRFFRPDDVGAVFSSDGPSCREVQASEQKHAVW